MSQNIPDFLNSRNEKIFLELPDYSFCHSSQTDEKTNSFFLGRDLLKSRLKNIIVSKSSKTGVYLVTGNRGVGKSCLVEEVIGKTSLRKININSYFNFLLLSFFLLLGLQYVNGISVVRNFVERWWFIAILSLVSIIIFTITGYISYLRHAKKQYAHDKKFLINLSAFWRTLLAAGQDFLRLPNKRNPFLRVQNVLKMILILLLIQIFSIFTPFSHFKLFVVYSCIIAGCHYFRYTKQTLINKFRNNYESNLDELEEKTLCERLINQKFPDWIWSIFVVFFSSMIPILLISRFDETSTVKNIASSAFFIIILVSTFLIFFIPFLRNRILIGDAIEKKDGSWLENWWKKTVITLKYSGLHFGKIVNYLENCNRVFLKINFGHDVLKERDILRLITRTLTTEYNVFCKSLKHRFYWHLLAIGVIFFITSIFYNNIYKNDIRPLIEHSSLYKTSSQLYYASDTNAKENKYLRKILVCNGNIHLYTTLKDTIKKYAINDQEKENGIRNLDIKIKKETKKRDNLRAEFFDKYLNNQANNNIEYLIYVDRAVNRAWFYLQNLPIFFWEKGYATKDTDIETINRRKENFNHAPVNYAWLLFFLSFYLLGYLI